MCTQYDGDIPPYFKGQLVETTYFVTDLDKEHEFSDHKEAEAKAKAIANGDELTQAFLE